MIGRNWKRNQTCHIFYFRLEGLLRGDGLSGCGGSRLFRWSRLRSFLGRQGLGLVRVVPVIRLVRLVPVIQLVRGSWVGIGVTGGQRWG